MNPSEDAANGRGRGAGLETTQHALGPGVAGLGRFSKPFRCLFEVAVPTLSPKVHFAEVELGIQISFVGKGPPFPKRGGIGHLLPHAGKCILASESVVPARVRGLCIRLADRS